MAIWAIADLHLALGVPSKNMDVFGPEWVNYMDKIATNWTKHVREDDLVLIAGDISWAMKMDEAKIDLAWLGALPGTKVMIKGNHDYWWTSAAKVRQILPPSCFIIQNDAFDWNGMSIGGTRLWDTPEYHFDAVIERQKSRVNTAPPQPLTNEDEKIFNRELNRLELSLKSLNQSAGIKIVMTHYPPIGLNLETSRVSELLEAYGVSICVFGHLHRVRGSNSLFGEKNGVTYRLTSADYLNFTPLLIKNLAGSLH